MNLSRVITANRLRISSFTAPGKLLMTPARYNTPYMGLHANPHRNFGFLMAIRPGFIMGKLKKVFSSRAGLYRFLFVVAGIHTIATFSGSLMDREVTMSVSDFYTNVHIKENELFKMYGILNKDSLHMKKGSLETKFSLTDFKNQVEVTYNGVNKFEFKEGETILITGYVPDIKKKNNLICVDYMTKHGMEVDTWKDAMGTSRESYGLMKAQGGNMKGYTRMA